MDLQARANTTDMRVVAGVAAISPQSDIESPPRTDQSFIIALKTEAVPILPEEYMASIFRATVEHQLLSGGMSTPQNVGLPNTRHDFLPDLGKESPVYSAQAQYQSSYASDIMGIRLGTENPSYSVNQNAAASFPMSNHYLHHQGPAAPKAVNLHDASGSDMSFGPAQYPLGQATYHHSGFTDIFVLQHAKPTLHSPSPGVYAELNPPPVYADGNPTGLMAQLHDHSRRDETVPSEEELGRLMPVENVFGCIPTIPEDYLYPRIPYIDHKFQQAKKAQLLLQNQSMNPLHIMKDTVIADHVDMADSSPTNRLTGLNEKGVYEHGEPSIPEIAGRGATTIEQANAWVDREFVSPNIHPESRLLPQGQSNALARVAEIPGYDSLYDPRYEQMGLPCDPHIRLLLAVHRGTSGQGQDGSS